ncbi:hypothetical protein BC829DRAFT_399232 [Chytridium lagenaria]|nr:hypothetical protein BC829DRAFT_399232 [Chytridium lagenaria]
MASKLANSVVLVIGATGNIGSGAVLHFLKAGANVVAPSRSPESLEKLKAFINSQKVSAEKLTAVPNINAGDAGDAEKLAKMITDKFQKLDHVVCSAGPWWNTPALHLTDFETFKKAINANVESHFLAWRYFGSLLVNRPGSSFTFVNGAALRTPQAGLTSATAASVAGLVAVVNVQTKNLPVRTNEVLISVRVESDEDFISKNMTPSEMLTHSSAFGKVFPTIALSSHKSERIDLTGVSVVDKLVKEAGL